jgi:hypothetical protein
MPKGDADTIELDVGALPQEFADSFPQLAWILCLAFPDHDHTPTQTPQNGLIPSITFDVALQLHRPKFAIRGRKGSLRAALVPVPEASMDENHRPVARKNKVWAPR